MQKLVSRGKRDFEVRKVVGKIINGEIDGIPACGNKNHLCYAKAIYQYCKTKVRYAFDPSMVEYIEDAAAILKSKLADCDSICILGCSMLEGIGIQCQFKTIKADRERPSEFSHVYFRANVPGVGWVNCDPTMPNQSFGWEAPGNWPYKLWWSSKDDSGPVDQTPSIDANSVESVLSSADQRYSNQLTGLRGLRMSGLACAGKPNCSCGCGPKLSGFGRLRGLGATEAETKVTIYGVVSGETLADINEQNAAYRANMAILDQKGREIAAMSPGADKDRAMALKAQAENSLLQQFQAYRQYRDAYNDFVTKASPYIPASLRPKLAGLGIFGLDDATVAIIAAAILAAGLAVLVDKLALYQAAAHGKDIETKGYLEQLSDLTGSVGGLMVKAGVVGAIAFAGYLFLKSRGLLGKA